MESPKEIIEKIRKIRFGIGLDTANLTEEIKASLKDKEKILNDASKLAKEIHSKDIHFIFELIQNADDNKYENPIPTMRFIVDSDCLIIQNNEKGFEEENVWALCGIGQTTKTKALGYIGEKGIGFKSVFMIADKVRIYSNGFQFQFWHSEENPLWKKWQDATMIIPEWIDKVPNFIDPKQTNIVLHLKPGKKEEINKYLKDIHPSLLLFLRKLKVIEIIEIERNEKKVRKIKLNEKNGIVEIVYNGKKNYYKVIKRLFDIPEDKRKERGKNVDKTEIILAFPLKEDYSPNTSHEQYVFAFLPIRKYGFNFIIQADFLLPVGREDIIKDNEWNEWIRDSIATVFLYAVEQFKSDEKLKFTFYDYLTFKDVKDEFFLPVIEQIYNSLQNTECILSESNVWKKPTNILIGDNEVKKLVSNEDLKKFFGKEYISSDVKAKKSILRKLGVEEFSINHLINCLKNEEWVKNQNDEWFANLFEYLSKQELSDEMLEQLKKLKIIKLENNDITSINEGVIFFPLDKEGEGYGFEDELRIFKREIINMLTEREKKDKDLKILSFLKKLGIQQPDPYEIIENHIIPIYENREWEQKSTKVLIGYIRYIKDHINKYEKHSNGSLERLKKSIRIGINKGPEGENKYEAPENIYLPKIYGNDNDLEKLFEGIDVPFVHPCYIEWDLKRIENEKKDEKEKKIQEWKNFFLKIGVNLGLRIKEINDNESYLTSNLKRKLRERSQEYMEKKGAPYRYSMDFVVDYDIEHLEEILDEIEDLSYKNYSKAYDKASILLKLIEKQWSELSRYRYLTYMWKHYSEYIVTTDSIWLYRLKTTYWLPTTQKTLAKPSEVFLDKPEIRDVLGDDVPYLDIKIENEYLIKALGINTVINVKSLLNRLKSLIENGNTNLQEYEKLYALLDKHFDENAEIIKKEFKENSLIFVPDADEEKKFYKTEEVIWKNLESIFGDRYMSYQKVSLEKHYPELEEFFINKLEIDEKPEPKYYANVLMEISEKKEIDDADRKAIIEIYRELNNNLDPDKVNKVVSKELWWNEFIQKPVFLADKGTFKPNTMIFINDDDYLYKLFRDEENIYFLWLPENFNPDEIKHLIEICNFRYLSKSVEIEILQSGSKDSKSTQEIHSLIPYIFRYLYHKNNEAYKKLKDTNKFEEISQIEVYTVDKLEVKYSISVDEEKKIEKKSSRDSIFYDGKLYFRKGAHKDNLIVEVSNLFNSFSKINGLTEFLLLITKTNEFDKRQIMKVLNISELPRDEKEFLDKITKIPPSAVVGKETEKYKKREQNQIPSVRKEPLLPTEVSSNTEEKETKSLSPEFIGEENKKDKKIEQVQRPSLEENSKISEVEEKPKVWSPECSPEEVEIRIEVYEPPEIFTSQTQSEEYKEKKPSPQPKLADTQRESLSEKEKREIGRWGEKYALYSIIKDKLLEHLNIEIKIEIKKDAMFEDILNRYSDIVRETYNGFNIEKDGKVIVEIIWENKNGESRKPYDIRIKEGKDEIFVEVKSTKDCKKAWFEVSKNQWHFMIEKGEKFYIYRVCGVKTDKVEVKKIQNPAKLWKEGKIDAHPIRIEL